MLANRIVILDRAAESTIEFESPFDYDRWNSGRIAALGDLLLETTRRYRGQAHRRDESPSPRRPPSRGSLPRSLEKGPPCGVLVTGCPRLVARLVSGPPSEGGPSRRLGELINLTRLLLSNRLVK